MTIRIVRIAVCIAAGMIVAGAGKAFAQAPDLIHACVKSQGQLRIVEATETCLSGERRLEWPAKAPAVGALRVLDANDKFIGWYGYLGLTTIAVGDEWIDVSLTADGPRRSQGGPVFYFNTPCPSESDNTILHTGGAHLAFAARELVKFALSFPENPNVVYYPGVADPAFVPLSYEYSDVSFISSGRFCANLPGPLAIVQQYAPPLTFDLAVFTAPFRVRQ